MGTDARAKGIEGNQILYHDHDEGVWVNQKELWPSPICARWKKVDKYF